VGSSYRDKLDIFGVTTSGKVEVCGSNSGGISWDQ
jgi:hypothetical protein